jgi:hypothetical protein
MRQDRTAAALHIKTELLNALLGTVIQLPGKIMTVTITEDFKEEQARNEV